jgi:hypothetical protein
MFLNGKIYEIKRASEAMKTAAARWLNTMIYGLPDPLQQYDAMLEAEKNLDFNRWLCKHLIPMLPIVEVTAENASEIRHFIELRHADPDRELALTILKQRRWEAENGNGGTTD